MRNPFDTSSDNGIAITSFNFSVFLCVPVTLVTLLLVPVRGTYTVAGLHCQHTDTRGWPSFLQDHKTPLVVTVGAEPTLVLLNSWRGMVEKDLVNINLATPVACVLQVCYTPVIFSEKHQRTNGSHVV